MKKPIYSTPGRRKADDNERRLIDGAKINALPGARAFGTLVKPVRMPCR